MSFGLKLSIFYYFLSLNYVDSVVEVQRRISGGEKAAPGQFPFSVLIMNEGQHVGSGSILTLEWILTVRLRRFIETL
jgi:hypothetical protein